MDVSQLLPQRALRKMLTTTTERRNRLLREHTTGKIALLQEQPRCPWICCLTS